MISYLFCAVSSEYNNHCLTYTYSVAATAFVKCENCLIMSQLRFCQYIENTKHYINSNLVLNCM
jgi:hypothetical protein